MIIYLMSTFIIILPYITRGLALFAMIFIIPHCVYICAPIYSLTRDKTYQILQSFVLFGVVRSIKWWVEEHPLISRAIYFIICSIIVFYINNTPKVCLMEGMELTDKLENGTINRTPLLQPGQTIKTLPHGRHNVTGGWIEIGFLGKGHVTKVIGFGVHGISPVAYIEGSQPFNTNFACVLYELNEAGHKYLTPSSLDAPDLVLGRSSTVAGPNAHIMNTFRTHANMGMSDVGQTKISKTLINNFAK